MGYAKFEGDDNTPLRPDSPALTDHYAPGAQLPAANGTDDTTAIQAVLTASAGKSIYGRPGESYEISAPLVISSGTTLDMTGCTVTLLASSNCNMIVNDAYDAGTGRDNDISIIGGTWDRGANTGANNDLHSMIVISCDRVAVRDVHYKATGGKFGIWIGECDDVVVEHCSSESTASDFVHLNGPIDRFHIDDIRGSSGDDFVALVGHDYPYVAAGIPSGSGDITNGTVSNISGTSAGASVVRLAAGNGPKIRDVTIENVRGTAGQAGSGSGNVVNIGDDVTQANSTGMDVDRLFVRNVTGVVNAGFGVVNMQGAGMGEIVVENVVCDQTTVVAYGLIVQASVTVNTLKVRGFHVTSSTLYHRGIVLQPGATIGDLVVSDASAIFPADNTLGIFLNMAAIPQRLMLSNVSMTGGNYCVYVTTAASGSFRSFFTNMYVNDVSNGLMTVSGAVAADVHISNVYMTTQQAFFVLGAAASLNLTASSSTNTSVWFYRSATQTIRANGACIRCDTGLLTPQTGDVVYNTDATETPGAGLVTYDGFKWVNLSRDLAYYLSGSNTSFVSVPDASDLTIPAAGMTFELTLRSSDLIAGSNKYIIAKAEGAGQRSFDCYMSGGSLFFRFYTDGTNAVALVRTFVGAQLSASVFKVLKIVAVPDNGANSTLDVYVDGVQVLTQVTGAQATVFDGTETLKFGGRSSGVGAALDLRRVRIINSSSTTIGDWRAGSGSAQYYDGTRVWTAAGATDAWYPVTVT